MPKPPPVERFQVTCEVEASQLGGIVAHFTKLGLENIHFELVTDVKTFKQNRKPETETNGTAESILMPWLSEHPTFKAIEAAKFLEAHGSSQAAVYPLLKKLCGTKTLKSLGGGNYARADIKHLAAPK